MGAIYSRNLLRRCIFSEIKYRHSKNIAIKRLDLVALYRNRDPETGKVMSQIAFRHHRHNAAPSDKIHVQLHKIYHVRIA